MFGVSLGALLFIFTIQKRNGSWAAWSRYFGSAETQLDLQSKLNLCLAFAVNASRSLSQSVEMFFTFLVSHLNQNPVH